MFQVDVVSDLKDYGSTDDGQRFIGEIIYVVVTFPGGDRYVHNRSWDGVKIHWCEENYCNYYEDIRPSAYEAANRLAARIRVAESIDLSLWSLDRPVYGSQAYQEYGQFDDIAWEKENG